MEKIPKLCRDVGKSVLLGLLTAAVLAVLFGLIGWLAGSFRFDAAVEAAKNGTMAVFALLLLIVAGMLLLHGKKPFVFPEDNGWYRHFSVIGPKTMLLCLSVGFVILVAVLDALQRSL